MSETEVICKSDCEFCQNEERVCSLDRIEVSQLEQVSPQLHCNQYVKALRGTRFEGTDVDRAMAAGFYATLKGRLEENNDKGFRR